MDRARLALEDLLHELSLLLDVGAVRVVLNLLEQRAKPELQTMENLNEVADNSAGNTT